MRDESYSIEKSEVNQPETAKTSEEIMQLLRLSGDNEQDMMGFCLNPKEGLMCLTLCTWIALRFYTKWVNGWFFKRFSLTQDDPHRTFNTFTLNIFIFLKFLPELFIKVLGQIFWQAHQKRTFLCAPIFYNRSFLKYKFRFYGSQTAKYVLQKLSPTFWKYLKIFVNERNWI